MILLQIDVPWFIQQMSDRWKFEVGSNVSFPQRRLP